MLLLTQTGRMLPSMRMTNAGSSVTFNGSYPKPVVKVNETRVKLFFKSRVQIHVILEIDTLDSTNRTGKLCQAKIMTIYSS